MKQKLFTALVLSLLVVSTAAVSACNTVEGFGRDLEGAGESIQKTSKK